MSLVIVESCTNCRACETVCPTGAVREAVPHFTIDTRACTECQGDFADPQCASICPVEEAILDATGRPINPVGSLTGVPPELRKKYTDFAHANRCVGG